MNYTSSPYQRESFDDKSYYIKAPKSLIKLSFTGWKESIGHGSKLKGFFAHIYEDLTDLT